MQNGCHGQTQDSGTCRLESRSGETVCPNSSSLHQQDQQDFEKLVKRVHKPKPKILRALQKASTSGVTIGQVLAAKQTADIVKVLTESPLQLCVWDSITKELELHLKPVETDYGKCIEATAEQYKTSQNFSRVASEFESKCFSDRSEKNLESMISQQLGVWRQELRMFQDSAYGDQITALNRKQDEKDSVIKTLVQNNQELVNRVKDLQVYQKSGNARLVYSEAGIQTDESTHDQEATMLDYAPQQEKPSHHGVVSGPDGAVKPLSRLNRESLNLDKLPPGQDNQTSVTKIQQQIRATSVAYCTRIEDQSNRLIIYAFPEEFCRLREQMLSIQEELQQMIACPYTTHLQTGLVKLERMAKKALQEGVEMEQGEPPCTRSEDLPPSSPAPSPPEEAHRTGRRYSAGT